MLARPPAHTLTTMGACTQHGVGLAINPPAPSSVRPQVRRRDLGDHLRDSRGTQQGMPPPCFPREESTPCLLDFRLWSIASPTGPRSTSCHRTTLSALSARAHGWPAHRSHCYFWGRCSSRRCSTGSRLFTLPSASAVASSTGPPPPLHRHTQHKHKCARVPIWQLGALPA
jgi:hypothetical protein